VVLLAVAVAAGLLAGLARRRVGVHAPRPRVEQVPLLGVGAALNAASILLDGDAATIALAGSLAVLIAVAVANRHVTGIVVVGLGLLVNLVSVAVNEGMPVRASALVRAGVVEQDEVATTSFSGARHLETDRDALGVLGDVLPIPFAREVMSFGDLLVVIGAGDAVRELSRRRAREWTEADREAYRWRRAATETRVDHVWGTAPSALPVSASQYSANPDADVPAVSDRTRESAVEPSPALVEATHNR
jgi:hypothetical protein